MLFRTHLVFGILTYFILNYFFIVPNKILFFIFVVLGAIIVDIDAKNSRAGKNFLLRPFQIFAKHRGFFHSIFFGILISVIIASFSAWAGFGFFAGFLSHLFLDFLTRSGVMIFWPWRKKFSVGIKSGGIFEEIFFVLVLLADFILFSGLFIA